MNSFTFTDNSAEVLAALERQKAVALEAIGLQAEGDVKLLTPVGTPESTGIKGYIGGTLRNSISHATDDDSAYIGTNVEYAPYVELGTSKMAAKPYLRPGIENNADTYKRIAEHYLKNG